MKVLFKFLRDYWKILSWIEKLISVLLPIVLSFILFAILNTEIICNPDNSTFSESFITSMLTVSSVLTAFGVAAVTILATSPSKSIENAKDHVAIYRKGSQEIKIEDSFNIPISFFQYVLIRGFYSVLTVIFLLILTFLGLFLIQLNKTIEISVIISISFIFIHSTISLIFYISSLYHILFRNDN